MNDKGCKIDICFDKPIMYHNNFRMVIDLSCVVVIDECNRWQPDDEKNNYPEGASMLAELNRNVNWAQHGFINVLQSHVEMIYAYQEAVIKTKETKQWMICPEYNDALLIIKALEVYQVWKDKIVNCGYEIHGKGWGDAMGFNNAKWNENNEKFLKLYGGNK